MLADLLSHSPLAGVYPNLLVGTESSDDAAVYRLNDEQAIVATTDFFLPIVDDPFDFGRIAATNAISDVYAMGGTPLFALALLGMPLGKLPVEAAQQILAGGAAVCKAAGIPIAGGHSIDNPEPLYGLVAIGQIDVVAEATMKIWDWAALVPVVEGAGGRVTDWQGQKLTAASNGQVLSVGDAAL